MMLFFFENANRKVKLKKEIWRRHYEPTYKISTESFDDYDNGFEIQSPGKQFVSWDTCYDELERNQHVVFEKSPYGQKVLKFKHPVRIGSVILYDFGSYFDNPRTDVPVLHFYAHCFDAKGTDKSYDDLKEILLKNVAVSSERQSYEREDQKNFNFNLNGMNLSICYTYDSEWQFNGGYTSLAVENKRKYPDYLIDNYYETKIVISDYLILEGKIGISNDYKRNIRVKRRPQKITELFDTQTVIWTDDVNGKIGFSSGDFSQVYDSKEIKSVCIQNILPAKGSGGGYLELILENQNSGYTIFSERCHFFDQYADSIKKLTNKELVFGQEQHDC